MDDIFASMFGGSGGFGMHFEDGGGPFHSFDSAGPGPSRRPRRGMDTDVKYEINLEEVYKGKTVIMNLERDRVCGGCKGSGGRSGVKPSNCKTCNGKGAVIQDRHVSTRAILMPLPSVLRKGGRVSGGMRIADACSLDRDWWVK